MKKLATTVQDFQTLIKRDFLYIDKTPLIHSLITGEVAYFLSRPRRFGKSLLVSTMAAIFQGKKELFKDTWIGSSDYDWEEYPVIWLDFSNFDGFDKKSVEHYLQSQLEYASEEIGVTFTQRRSPVDSFEALIRKAAATKQVVILVDEYDKPLLNSLKHKNELIKIRDFLANFYTVIKKLNRYIRYTFITGVSAFARVSLFSGMNSLKDISLSPDYAALTGITHQELETNYSEHIAHAAERLNESPKHILELMRQWYNGYCFSEQSLSLKVYNPVSLHLFLSEASFENFWFDTGMPTFAYDLIRSKDYSIVNLEKGVTIGDALTKNRDLTHLKLIPLLFQIGYLTIVGYDEIEKKYLLGFPNREVEDSFFDCLLSEMTDLEDDDLSRLFASMRDAVRAENLEKFFEYVNSYFAEMPHNMHVARESFYHSLFYTMLRSMKVKVEAEVSVSGGRLDIALFTNNTVYVFELKFNSSAEEALKQINEKRYVDRYKSDGKKIVLVGVNVKRKPCVVDWVEQEYISQ